MQKYLVVKLKNGESKEYLWDSISFYVDDGILVVWENQTKEMLLRVPTENILYYERVINGD